MTETIVRPPAPARRGEVHVNRMLDYILLKSRRWTTDKLADIIARDNITGQPDTVDRGPVGLWVVGKLQEVGVPAASYTWMSTLVVYDTNRAIIGEITVPEHHTLRDLDTEVNDLDRPELCDQGEGDQR